MGVHRWTGYAAYESACIRNYFQIVVDFCYSCHGPFTEDEGCETCPLMEARAVMFEYLAKAYEWKYFSEEKQEVLREFVEHVRSWEEEQQPPPFGKKREKFEELFQRLEDMFGPFPEKINWNQLV